MMHPQNIHKHLMEEQGMMQALMPLALVAMLRHGTPIATEAIRVVRKQFSDLVEIHK